MQGPSAIGNGTEITLTLETFSQNITALSDLSLGWWRAGFGEGWRAEKAGGALRELEKLFNLGYLCLRYLLRSPKPQASKGRPIFGGLSSGFQVCPGGVTPPKKREGKHFLDQV